MIKYGLARKDNGELLTVSADLDMYDSISYELNEYLDDDPIFMVDNESECVWVMKGQGSSTTAEDPDLHFPKDQNQNRKTKYYR